MNLIDDDLPPPELLRRMRFRGDVVHPLSSSCWRNLRDTNCYRPGGARAHCAPVGTATDVLRHWHSNFGCALVGVNVFLQMPSPIAWLVCQKSWTVFCTSHLKSISYPRERAVRQPRFPPVLLVDKPIPHASDTQYESALAAFGDMSLEEGFVQLCTALRVWHRRCEAETRETEAVLELTNEYFIGIMMWCDRKLQALKSPLAGVGSKGVRFESGKLFTAVMLSYRMREDSNMGGVAMKCLHYLSAALGTSIPKAKSAVESQNTSDLKSVGIFLRREWRGELPLIFAKAPEATG